MFSYPTEIVPVLIIAICYLAIVACYTKSVFTIRVSRLQLLLLPVAGYCYLLIGKQERAFHLWNRASQYYAAGNYKESLVSYQQAYVFLQHNGLFLSHYGKALSMDGRSRDSRLVLLQSREYQEDAFTCLAIGDDYKALGLYDQAVESYQLAAAMVPVQLYPRYCLARLYVEKGDTVKAIPVAKEILYMQEKVSSPAVQQIKQEMKDLLEALNKK
jgi:tetratricopeptide (TPR) repeat protein